MTDPADPGAIHIPDYAGRPICGASGRTSAVLLPTCRDCEARVSVAGMKPEDAFNPAHPVGRVAMGSGFGVPGFPQIPGLWKRFRGGGKGDRRGSQELPRSITSVREPRLDDDAATGRRGGTVLQPGSMGEM